MTLRALLFDIAGERYGLPVARVERVYPGVSPRAVPGAPAWVLGVATVEGLLMPVVDLGCLVSGKRSEARLGTRIARVLGRTPGGRCVPLGLLAEGMTEVGDLRADPAGSLHLSALPFLARTLLEGGATVQLVDPDRVIDERLERLLDERRP